MEFSLNNARLTSKPYREVQHTSEFDRILRLPRRRLEEAEDWVDKVTQALKTPNGTMKFRPLQATALAELYTYGGLFAAARVGSGKTLITFCAPTLLGSKRPLLLVPAKLREKTRREFSDLGRHFKAPKFLRIESYEMLSRVKYATMLDDYCPDLIMADECHRLRNNKASCTRRVRRYMNDHPDTVFVALSGTIMKRSIRDYWYLLRWSLKQNAPIPLRWSDIEEWSLCLDEKVVDPVEPGALIQFCSPEDAAKARLGNMDWITACRRGFSRRLTETPGVVSTAGDQVACSLQITALIHEEDIPTSDKTGNVDYAFQELRKFVAPDGHELTDGIAVWRHARELALGFYYRWDPWPPREWMAARFAWAKIVRKILSSSHTIDTELQVAQQVAACIRAGKPHEEEGATEAYQKWKAIENTFVVKVVPVWLDDGPLERAAKWMKDHCGIVWVEHVAFGERLSKETGVPYYGDQGIALVGGRRESIEVAAEKAKKQLAPIIASVASNSEGRNLQAWSRNLVVSPLPTGKNWEQLLGRTHRDGQEADEVSFEVYFTCYEHVDAMEKAIADAKAINDTTGQLQKLAYADVDFTEATKLVDRSRDKGRWKK